MSGPQPPGTPNENPALLLERYRIERVIGEGAFGRVYLAMDTRLQRNVAIKELLASRERTDPVLYAEYLARFEREARATGTIQQPNVVTVYDLHVDDAGNNYLVMEYVDGTNLRDLLAQVGTLPVGRAVAIATDVAKALEAVHDHLIVHRDVKPANIMITRRGVAKLMNFGVALVAGEQQMTAIAGGHPGTQGYMSPEQATAYGPIDGRSDLYSLGLVLYEMLTGTAYARRHQQISAVRTDLPPALVAIVDRLMAPAADARYQSASDLVAALQDLGEIGSTASQPAPIVSPSQAPWGAVPPGSVPPGNPAAAYGNAPPPVAPPGYATGTLPPGGYGMAPPPPYGATTGVPYGGSPPLQPQPKSNRGLLFGIIGALVALVVIVATVFALTNRGNSQSAATATPLSVAAAATTPAATVASTTAPTATTAATSGVGASLSTPTRGATIAVSPTVTLATPTVASSTTPTVGATPSRPATTPTTPPAALSDTWTDADGLMTMKFPGSWTKTRDTTDSTNLVEFSVSNGPFVDVYLNDPQQGTIAEEVQFITRNQGNSQKYNYTNQTTQDVTIAGEPAKAISFTYTDKTDASKVFTGTWWVVNHDGRQYSIAVGPMGSSRPTIDAMVASVTFPPTKITTWLDTDKAIRARYPKDWTASSDSDNALILNGANDEIHIFVTIAPVGNVSIDQEFKSIRDNGSDDGKTVRTYDPVTDTKIGGQAGKSMAYKYTQKGGSNLQPGIATIWTVDYKGKRYEFFCSNMASHRQEIEGFINTITFVK